MARIIPLSAALVFCAGLAAFFSPQLGHALALGLIGLCGVGLLLSVVLGSSSPRWQLFGPATLRLSATTSRVLLSFDDGPDPASTDDLLNALDAHDATATFFVLLDRAEAHPELLRRIAQRCEVGLHGATHDAHLVWTDPSRAADELKRAANRLQALCGQTIRYYRPPFGVTSPRLFDALKRAQLKLIWCSVRPYDGVALSDARWMRRCTRAQAGDILLMHEGDRPARRLLPQLLRHLKQRGLLTTALSEHP